MAAEKLRSAGLFFFYGGLCRKVLVERALLSGFLIAAALHGVGHAATALAAGLLGTALAGDSLRFSRLFGWAIDPVTLTFVGLAGTAVKGAGATVGATLQSRLAQNVAGIVRRNVASLLLHKGSSLPAGHLAARLTIALREVERGVDDGLLVGARACLSLVPLGVGLALVSSKLAWWAVLLFLPFAVLLSIARSAWKRSYVRALAIAEGLHRELDELVVHMDVWRVFGAADHVCLSLDRLSEQAAHASSRAEGARAALSSANEVVAALILVLCAVLARFRTGPLLDGTFVAFAVPFFMAYRPIRDLGDARTAFERGAHAFASLEGLIAQASEEPSGRPSSFDTRHSPLLRVPFGDALHLGAEHLNLEQLPDRAWSRAVLQVDELGVERIDGLVHRAAGRQTHGLGDAPTASERGRVSFEVRPGEILAIVGPTGSGKTTLLRALLGLEPSARGAIRYGDADLSRAGVGPSERPFAWVPQDAPVIAGSLDTNVLLGRETPRRVTEILRSLGASRLIDACALAELGASGRPVSGGERKWIAIARAIASDLPILLLDEPTVGLDAEAERAVLAEFQRLRRTRSIVLVTHQRGVAEIADRVVEIGENGTAEMAAPAPPNLPPDVQNSPLTQ